MAILPIVPYPDPRLRTVAQPVTSFDAALENLAKDLDETMRAAPGIGITAPHVGIALRLAVIALDQTPARFFVNPRVVWSSPQTTRYAEGSVSMPGVVEEIERPASVNVAYQDLNGADQSEAADGLLSICLQHEIDQLDGVFWLQRLSRLRRERVIRRFEKLTRADRHWQSNERKDHDHEQTG